MLIGTENYELVRQPPEQLELVAAVAVDAFVVIVKPVAKSAGCSD